MADIFAQILRTGFHSQSHDQKTVSNHVEPNDLTWEKRNTQPHTQSGQNYEHLTGIGRQQIKKHALNRLVNISAFLDSGNNPAEIIVKKNYIGRILCNFRSYLAH